MQEGNIHAIEQHVLEKRIASAASFTANQIKLSEEEALDFLSNWNLVVTYSLLDIEGLLLTPETVAQRLNILKPEAQNLIDTLKNMKLIESTEVENAYKSVPLFFDDSFMSSADILSLFLKNSQISLSKLNSTGVYGFRFEVLSRRVLQKYKVEMDNLILKMAEESKGESDREVYGSSISFTKITRTKGDK